MFQFPRFASLTYEFSQRYTLRCGFPHSDISGSKPTRSSPELIAACHVLHRLSVPRHPPNALVILDPYQKSDVLQTRTNRVSSTHRADILAQRRSSELSFETVRCNLANRPILLLTCLCLRFPRTLHSTCKACRKTS